MSERCIPWKPKIPHNAHTLSLHQCSWCLSVQSGNQAEKPYWRGTNQASKLTGCGESKVSQISRPKLWVRSGATTKSMQEGQPAAKSRWGTVGEQCKGKKRKQVLSISCLQILKNTLLFHEFYREWMKLHSRRVLRAKWNGRTSLKPHHTKGF